MNSKPALHQPNRNSDPFKGTLTPFKGALSGLYWDAREALIAGLTALLAISLNGCMSACPVLSRVLSPVRAKVPGVSKYRAPRARFKLDIGF